MAPTRLLTKTIAALVVLSALFAPSALAAEGVGPAKKLVGTSTTSATSSGATKTTGSSKEVLTLSTLAPLNGTTVSGTVGWEVTVTAGAPTKVEFLVDGTAKFSDSSAPYGGNLDTTKLSNGGHTLSATAYGSKGVKATTSVKVTVSNATSTPAPEIPTSPETEPVPGTGSGAPIYWGATVGTHLTGTQPPWDMAPLTVFEEEVHKKVSMVNFFQPFANCNPTCSFYGFPKTPLENIRMHGS
ncbi:MAG TPA: Ig-like domain-containing protein, partial [Solirubrobacterales bacterium]|nr:Ig-like domain-containing protein [Solirubrobacterales bacterium]